MVRSMIIGRLRPGVVKEQIIHAFQISDATELPHMIGVHCRSVFILGDIYVHLIEAEVPVEAVLTTMKDNFLFKSVKQDLDQFIESLAPELYPGIAEEIYSWSAEAIRQTGSRLTYVEGEKK